MLFKLLSHVPFFYARLKKQCLIECRDEINANMERLFVTEQRQFVTDLFETRAVVKAVSTAGICLPKEIYTYKEHLEAFNNALKDARDFQAHSYVSAEQKTRANAEILEQKKEKTDEHFKLLRPVIMAAQTTMRALLNAA